VNRNLNWQQFAGVHPEEVSVDELMTHREYIHGPGSTKGVDGTQYAPKRTPEEWAALKTSIATEGVKNPLHFSYDNKTNSGYLSEGNSRLQAAYEVGEETVPVVGNRSSGVPDNPNYKLDEEPTLKGEEGTGYFPADFRVSAVLPKRYMPRG
jgi:hypothetical protein